MCNKTTSKEATDRNSDNVDKYGPKGYKGQNMPHGNLKVWTETNKQINK